MRSAIIVSALMSITALAHPTVRDLHLHAKRHDQQPQIGKPQLDRVWKDSDGVTHQEYKVVEKITIGPGQSAPSGDNDSQPDTQQQQVTQTSQKSTANDDDSHQHHDSDNHQSQQQVKAVAQDNHQDQHQQPQHQQQQQQVQQPQPSAQPEQPAPSKAAAPQQTEQKQTTSSSSGGGDVLSTINTIRKQWDGSLNDYDWADNLEKNACSTADGSEQGGTQQVHTLNPGSMGQCIAPGKAGDITSALKMWLCEIPKSLSCGNSKRAENIFARGSDPQGHAKIFGSTDYKKIGCCFRGELWTCDFSP